MSRATPVGVIGDLTGSEVDTLLERSYPDKSSPQRTSWAFDATMSSTVYVAGDSRPAGPNPCGSLVPCIRVAPHAIIAADCWRDLGRPDDWRL